MVVIGLTGRSCSGKNVYAREFERHGYRIVDADAIVHEAYASHAQDIAREFGQEVLDEHGMVHRKKLGQLVFANPTRRTKLEQMTHPWVIQRAQHEIEQARAAGETGIVLNVPLLSRAKMDKLCDLIVFVTAPFEQRLQRAMQRDGVTEEGFAQREASQADIHEDAICKGIPVFVMHNDGELGVICRQVSELCDTITQRMSFTDGQLQR